MKRNLFFVISILFSLKAFSVGDSPKEIARKSEMNFQLEKSSRFQKLAYEIGLTLVESRASAAGECNPDTSGCIDAACSFMQPYLCDEIREINQIGEACRGNFDGSCLRAGCSQMQPYLCDEPREVMAMARACVGVTHGSCIKQVCSRMQPYQCDEPREIYEVIATCRGAR